MSAQVQAVRLITPEMAREHIASALEIVAELELDDELREVAFVQACQMLAARATMVEQPQAFAIPGGLLGGRDLGG